MRRPEMRCWVVVLLALALVQVTAADDGATAAKLGAPTEAMMAPYTEMIEKFKFSAEQTEKLTAAVAEKQEALRIYLKEKGPAWKMAMEEFGSAKDAAAKEEAKKTVDALQAGFDTVVAEHEEKIARLLTAEQRREWLTLLLNRAVVTALSKVTVGHGPGGEMTAIAKRPDAATLDKVAKLCAEKARKLLEDKGAFDPRVQKRAAEEIAKEFARVDPAAE